WLKPSFARSSATMSASVRDQMPKPSCVSCQLGSPTTTRFTRTRLSDIVHPVSSSQLTQDPDRVRSFGGYNILRRHQTNIVSKRGKLASDVMRSGTCFHADQAARNVGQPALKLSARAFELPNDRPALIETDKMEAILTEIDADRADGRWCGLV